MKKLLRREWQAVWRDPWQLALISYLPLIGVLCLWWLFSAGLPRQLPVALVDQDNSSLSRELGRHLEANPVTAPRRYLALDEAVEAMRRGEVYALVILPYGLKQELLTGHTPTIDLRYNGQFLLVGKLLASQLQLTLADGLQQVARLKQLAAGVNPSQVEVRLSPVSTQTTALFNRNNNYVGFLVPPVLIALWQLLAMLAFAGSLNRELRQDTLGECFRLGMPSVLLSKFMVNGAFMLLHGGFILVLLYQLLGLPIAGQLLWLLPMQILMLMAVWLWVQGIFFMLADSARVISFCTALFAPAFAFMGITFPTGEMPLLAQWWRLLMPSSHYIESHVALVSYGAGPASLLSQALGYLGFLLLLIPSWFFARRYARVLQSQLPLEETL